MNLENKSLENSHTCILINWTEEEINHGTTKKRTGAIIASIQQIESDSHSNMFSLEYFDSGTVFRHIQIQTLCS